MVEKAFSSSPEERDRLIEDGYAVVAVTQSTPDGEFAYCLEKGSEWSQMLGSK